MKLNFKTIGSIVATLLLIALTTALAQQDGAWCPPNMTGRWTASDGVVFDFVQDLMPDFNGGYRVTGTANADGTCIQNVPVTGYIDASGNFTDTADASMTQCGNRWWEDYAAPVQLPGCHDASGYYLSEWGDGMGIPFTWGKPCEVPEGEVTFAAGIQGDWSIWAPTTFEWLARVQTTANLSFVGRTIEESPSVNYTAVDTCRFDGAPFEDVANSLIEHRTIVSDGNVYGDQVGWLPEAVHYYRNTVDPATGSTHVPCGYIVYQVVWMHCDNGVNIPFWENVLTATIAEDWVQSCRGGKCVGRYYVD